MKKTYLLYVIMTFILALTITGCASKTNETGSNSTATSNSNSSSTSSTASTSSNEPEAQTESATSDSWLPAGDKPVLRQLNINASVDYNTYPVVKDIEELTGYKVEYDMLPSEAPMDKLNLIMAAGEDYDMVVIGGDTAIVMDYAAQGALMDINPWLQYAPNLSAALNQYEIDTFTLNGGLYALGMEQLQFDGRGDVRSTIWLRQDWLDELGLPVPTTIDEFTDTLRAFKGYTNDTGNPTIPFTITSSTVAMDNLIGAFGLPLSWNEVDGKLVYRGADPRMKDYLNYLKGLYQEGLLDAEYPANQGANVNEKFTTGMAGAAPYAFYDPPSILTTMDQTQPNAKMLYLPPVKGPNGDIGIGTYSGGFDRIAFIPATTKNIEHVINFIDLKLVPETFQILTVGYEGVHYTVNEQGEKWPILPTFFDDRSFANNYSTGRYASVYSELWKTRNRKDPRQNDCWTYLNGPAFEPYIINSDINKAPAFPETSKNKQSLDQMLLDQHIKIIAGSETTDTYDAFLERWMSEGGEAMTREYNDWYSTFKK